MKKIISIMLFPALVSCAEHVPDKPCMKDNEFGIVQGFEETSYKSYGRYGGVDNQRTHINVSVNGISRICAINKRTLGLFKIGQKVNLSGAIREY